MKLEFLFSKNKTHFLFATCQICS